MTNRGQQSWVKVISVMQADPARRCLGPADSHDPLPAVSHHVERNLRILRNCTAARTRGISIFL